MISVQVVLHGTVVVAVANYGTRVLVPLIAHARHAKGAIACRESLNPAQIDTTINLITALKNSPNRRTHLSHPRLTQRAVGSTRPWCTSCGRLRAMAS